MFEFAWRKKLKAICLGEKHSIDEQLKASILQNLLKENQYKMVLDKM